MTPINYARAACAALALGLAALTPPAVAASADEQGFVASYRKAFEAKDTKTLQGFLYTKGADPMVLEFYKAMQSEGAGEKITTIELVDLSTDEATDASKPKDGPGGKMVLPLKPTKKLVIKVETKNDNGSSTSTNTCFVAEADGKLVIPVPGPSK